MEQIISKLISSIKKMNDDDKELFSDIFNAYAVKIYYLCLIFLTDVQTCEDITFESFIGLLKTSYKVQKPAAVKKWLFTNALQKTSNILASSKTSFNEKINTDEEKNSLDFYHMVDQDAYIRNDSRLDFSAIRDISNQLINSISALSNSQRTVLIAYYFCRMTIKEISWLEEISENAVKNRIFNARKYLEENTDNSVKKLIPFIYEVYDYEFGVIEVPQIIKQLGENISSPDISLVSLINNDIEIENPSLEDKNTSVKQNNHSFKKHILFSKK